MTQDKNTFPYNDDYDPAKKYYQILFRPGTAVQARELSQIQSLLQNQINSFGQHVFQDGSMVIPGAAAINTLYPFIKLLPQYSSTDIDLTQFVGKTIVGQTSGTSATVLQGVPLTISDPNTLYLQFQTGVSSQSLTAAISSGSKIVNNSSIATSTNLKAGAIVTGTGIPANTFIVSITNDTTFVLNNVATATNATAALTVSTADTFTAGEVISTVETTPIHAQLAASSATGFGAIATIQEGIYFVKGYFVFVEQQSLILDKYTNTPNYNIGLVFSDSFVTADDDITLNDPATGSTNFNAPGADRYFIDMVLSKFALDATVSENFIQLSQVENGVVQTLVTRPAYSELEKTLARRTFDESGNYTVSAFPLQVREHLNNGTNNGVYTIGNGGDATKLILSLDAGKAYVEGFEIESQSTIFINADKPRTTLVANNASISTDFGNYVLVNTVTGTFNISTYEAVTLKNGGATTIGSAKVRGQTLISGTPGDAGAIYKLNLFDVTLTGSYLFQDVATITASGKSAVPIFDSNGHAQLVDVGLNNLLIPVNQYAIKTFKPGNVLDTNYIVRRYLSGTMSTTTLVLTAGTNEIFEAGNVLNYHVSIITASGTATGNGFAAGNVIDMVTGGNSIVLGGSPTGLSVTLTIPQISGSTIAVIATIKKTLAPTEKTKTLTTRTQNLSHGATITLDKCDIYSLTSVTDDSAGGADITKRYSLDNGQRDNYYAPGTLTLLDGYAEPVGNVTVTYQYFAHGTGDYFSVDSYNGVIPYENIGFYRAQNGIVYDLHNTLDFRPRIADGGSGFSVYSELVSPGEAINADYEYYLGRIDKIFLTPDGSFQLLSGTPSINPLPPKEPEHGMVLYNISLPPYTFFAKDAVTKLVENKRYTMRDIGDIDERVSNLEYYVSLSLLEKSTADLQIDDGTGNNAFKNGFIVDNFTSHKVGDVVQADYQCSIDPSAGNLRPQFNSDNVALDVNTSGSSNYTLTGSLATLPYTSILYINQPFASKTENLNPYNIFTYVGEVDLTPSSDDWYETQMTPDIDITTSDGLANAYASLNGQVIWNDWQTAWVGQTLSDVQVNPDATVNDPWSAYNWSTADGLNSQYTGRQPTIYLGGATAADAQIGANIGGVLITDQIKNTTLDPSGTLGFLALGIDRDIITSEVGQTRTGVMTTVVPTTTTQVINESVLDTSTIPFMRSNTIAFGAKFMLPNTRVYPFFDNVDVSVYCAPQTGEDSNGPIYGTLGDPLLSNAVGEVHGQFNLPNNPPTIQFRTGAKEFKLIDDPSGNAALANTMAVTTYSAAGILQTKQDTILSTESAQLVQTTVTDSRVTVGTNVQDTLVELQGKCVTDPLSQTFLIDVAGGVFINKIDIFFASKDIENNPAQLQLREVVNGYPGPKILPMSTVTYTPDQVNVSSDGSVATTFVFEAPIYLQDSTEYCFVLLANSNQYTVYCSAQGGIDLITGSYISQQPYSGVLFKSQNASTWTAVQEEDIKFKIYRCSFNTSTPGIVQFVNDEAGIIPLSLTIDPFNTTSSSATVAVYHPNHGLTTGNKTTIAGVSGTQNGITDANLNGQQTVTVVDLDNYTFVAGGTATATGACGGTGITATHNLLLDVANVNIQNLTVSGTNINWGLKTTTTAGTLDSTFSAIVLGQNLQYLDARNVYNADNDLVGGSAIVQATLSTTVENLSPVIDTTRSSIIIVSNRINDLDTNELASSGGEAIARYITKKVTLASAANSISVYFDATRPAASDIEVYIKYQDVNNQATNFDSLPYVLVPAVQYPAFDDFTFYSYQFELDGIQPYSVFAVKIVMKSTDSAQVPVISGFRAIAVTK